MSENADKFVKPLGTLSFSLVSILVGATAGAGAIVFRALIALFHNLSFLGTASSSYDATVHTPPSALGPFVILIPVAGALVVAYLVKNFAPEAKGHGVPEVMEAIYYHRGAMRPIVAVIKSVASAISIGTGGSVGREGPIVQIGSAFSSAVGGWLRLPAWQRITLIAGGAGGGIAATFNTPVGGVLFAMELMLHEVSARTLVPVAISTVTATYIGQIAFGPHPSFVIPAFELPFFHLANPLTLLAYADLGVLAGSVSALFVKTLYWFEALFERRIKGSYYRQHALGMFIVGSLMYGVMTVFGHYYIQGVGYATIQDLLSGVPISLFLLCLLFGLKLLATALTLGSGASGGVFSPALFMGATLGQVYGIVLRILAPAIPVSPPALAVAGMAGVVGGSTGAAMAAIVMIFEMTLDYRVIIPMTLTVAISYGVRRALSRQSIYAEKLALRGHSVPEALEANVRFTQSGRTLMETSFRTIPASRTLDQLRKDPDTDKVDWFVVQEHNQAIGLISPKACELAAQSRSSATAGDIARRDFCTVREDMQLREITTTLHRNNASVALLVPDGGPALANQIEGFITKSRIADALAESVEELEK